MATYTSNYGWTKPSGSDNVDISVLNDNLDDQDSTIHNAFLNMAPPFSESSTYAVDDIVLYTTGLYKCHTAVTTPGSWTGSTNWQVYKLSEGGSGGGGTSNYNDLTNKPSINGVTLTGNKTASDLGITASGVGAIPSTDKGANGGVAELDSNGKVPSSQLPSYVDDVLSYSSQSAFPATGETGKIYIAEDTNKTYRWSGSAYAEISASLALGETSSTAYRGDRGKTAYDHSQKTGNPHGTTKSDVGLGNVPNVSTNDQEPTFTEATTRNNIASGEKLSVILGKVQKFFNDLKTVAFSGSYTDLTNQPQINGNTLTGNKTTGDLGINADNVMLSDGVTSVEDRLDELESISTDNITITGFVSPFEFQKIGRIVFVTYNGDANNLPTGALSFPETLPEKYRPAITSLALHSIVMAGNERPVVLRFSSSGAITGYNYRPAISSATLCHFGTVSYLASN